MSDFHKTRQKRSLGGQDCETGLGFDVPLSRDRPPLLRDQNQKSWDFHEIGPIYGEVGSETIVENFKSIGLKLPKLCWFLFYAIGLWAYTVCMQCEVAWLQSIAYHYPGWRLLSS